jgi:hypothetical protein
MAGHGASCEGGGESQGHKPDSLFDGHGRGLLSGAGGLAIFGVKISRLGGEVTKRMGRNFIEVKPAVGFTLPSAGVTSFGFAQDRLCTQ